MPENTELKTLVQSIETVQKSMDSFNDKLDVLEKDKVEKAADAATKAIDAMNAAGDQIKALEEQQKELELLIAKGHDPENKENVEYNRKMALYLKKGIEIPSDILNPVIDSMAKSMDVDGTNGDLIKKDLVSGIGPDGGYWISPERSSSVSKRVFETSPMDQIATRMSTTSNEVEILLDDDEASYIVVGETTTPTTTDTPQISVLKIPVNEIAALPRATRRMLEDAGFDIEGWLNQKVSDAFSRGRNNQFFVGDGVAKARGILDYSAWAVAGTYERNALEQLTSGTSGSFDADDFIELQNMLLEDYQANATWLMRRAAFGEVMKLKSSSGDYLLNPRIVAEGAKKILLGNPVRFAADMQAVAADGLAVAYGDFRRGYTIVDRKGILVIRDPYTSKPYTLFYTTMRFGGAVTNFQAIKIMKIKA